MQAPSQTSVYLPANILLKCTSYMHQKYAPKKWEKKIHKIKNRTLKEQKFWIFFLFLSLSLARYLSLSLSRFWDRSSMCFSVCNVAHCKQLHSYYEFRITLCHSVICANSKYTTIMDVVYKCKQWVLAICTAMYVYFIYACVWLSANAVSEWKEEK